MKSNIDVAFQIVNIYKLKLFICIQIQLILLLTAT